MLDVVDPEIRAEREFMCHCRAELVRMRTEVRAMLDRGAAEGDAVVDKHSNHMLREYRKQVVKDLTGFDDLPLFFGRLEYPAGEVYDGGRDIGSHTHLPDGDLVYIGRRGLRDEDGEPVVVDWRAPLSRAFYEASPAESMDVRVRRRYGFDRAGTLSAYEDEPLMGTGVGVGGEHLLQAEIERPRQGPMRDIVATIQPEQMRLVRAPFHDTMCIQGAPGTGKTAVGLHRLAFLLFAERERLRKEGGVAVIGPNRSFLSYIRDVLPALGELEVVQATIDDLLSPPGVSATGVDDLTAARVKGSPSMAEVIRRHLWTQVREPVDPAEVVHGGRTWRLSVDEQARELAEVRGRGTGYGAGRELLAQRLAVCVRRRMERSTGSSPSVTRLSRSAGVTRALRRMWPAIDPARLVLDLLTDPTALAIAADGLLSKDDQRAVVLERRPRSVKAMPWSSLDLALIDEAAALVERPHRLGHVVVDEAQDLSPMQFRAIARRVSGACTILGDLAQATGPSAVRNWTDVLAHLNRSDGHVEVLYRGYRVPAEIIDYASRLLPHIAAGLRGPVSFRHNPDALHVERTDPAHRLQTVLNACRAAAAHEGSVGVIAADADIPRIDQALTDDGLPHTTLGGWDVDPERVVLVPASLAKGLEYDTVVLMEPAHIVVAEPRGLQRLYVALTRAVSSLQIVHAEPLPTELSNDNRVR